MRVILFVHLSLAIAMAAEHRGVVRFNGVPVPGVTVSAAQGGTHLSAITDSEGMYRFADIAEGTWAVRVEMQLFEAQHRDIAIVPGAQPEQWELNAAPPSFTPRPASTSTSGFHRTTVSAAKKEKPAESEPAPAVAEATERAADGFLINGSVNNGAASPFAQLPAFGNNRRGPRSMYNGNLGVILNNSLFDARAFSLTGQATPKPEYSRFQALLAFGGPLKVPGLINRNGPNFTLNYQWTRNSNATTQTGLMPTMAERSGDFGGAILDPLTGTPFAGNRIPQNRISPQARALLDLYPAPNFDGSSRYNYQVPVVSGLHQDDLQTRLTKQVRRNYFGGDFAWQSVRSDNTDLFGFLDTSRITGFNTGFRYRRGVSPRTYVGGGIQLNRLETEVTPYFSNLRNVSGDAGITGNNQDPVNWGPPSLRFASGISPLTQKQASLSRNQTATASVDAYFSRGRHNIMMGYNRRWQQFNVLSQQDARGSFVFTGGLTGQDFASFLLGIPDTVSIAYGNADKYLRASVNEAFLNDDWRVNPSLTINLGVRWEYWSPVTEKYGRLVNLDASAGYAPAVARDDGSSAFPQPDRNNIAPRISFAWRPMPAASMVVRGGYGIYYDTSVYLPIAMQMAQQAPLSQSLRYANTTRTMANAFAVNAAELQSALFGVDPGFRIGYSQNWQLSVQTDLPAALQMTTTYSGSKGTRGQQQILPNTFPDGSLEPSGFTWLMSNGNAIRHAAQMQLRRRLRSGLMANLQYTWSKSIDNAALGGRSQSPTLTAQNWLDLAAERALSDFDQRHALSAMIQYTTGMGLRGGAFAGGWRGALLKEWTFASQITLGSGLPLTPVYLSPVRGTGVTGTLRPDYTGAPLYDAAPGFFLNPSAYAAPVAAWGNAGRNSITGPKQFVLNASIGRTFRSTERLSVDLRVEATNALNHPVFTSWNTVLGNAQFGLPNAVSPMRSVQVALRTRF